MCECEWHSRHSRTIGHWQAVTLQWKEFYSMWPTFLPLTSPDMRENSILRGGFFAGRLHQTITSFEHKGRGYFYSVFGVVCRSRRTQSLHQTKRNDVSTKHRGCFVRNIIASCITSNNTSGNALRLLLLYTWSDAVRIPGSIHQNLHCTFHWWTSSRSCSCTALSAWNDVIYNVYLALYFSFFCCSGRYRRRRYCCWSFKRNRSRSAILERRTILWFKCILAPTIIFSNEFRLYTIHSRSIRWKRTIINSFK